MNSKYLFIGLIPLVIVLTTLIVQLFAPQTVITTLDYTDDAIIFDQTYECAKSGLQLLKTAENDLVIIGSDDEGPVILKLNASGTLEWQKSINIDYVRAFVQLSTGDLVLSGNNNSDFCLLKLDLTGAVLWHHSYATPQHETNNDIVQSDFGGFFLIGNQDRDAWVLKVDDSGEEEWNTTIKATTTGNNRAWACLQTIDDDCVFTGHSRYDTGVFVVWLVKINATGQVEWIQTYGDYEQKNYYWLTGYGYSLINTADGGYAIVGEDSHTGLLWLKTDQYGNLENYNSFSNKKLEEVAYVGLSLLQTSNEGFMLAGRYYGYNDNDLRDAYLVRTTQNGDLEWEMMFSAPNIKESSFNSIIEVNENVVAMIGYKMLEGEQSKLWLLKIDLNVIQTQFEPLLVNSFILSVILVTITTGCYYGLRYAMEKRTMHRK